MQRNRSKRIQRIWHQKDKKYQQERLLLLFHASKCPYTEGCRESRQCTNTKKVWNHIFDCQSVPCKELQCYSSRFVLTHFHHCKDIKCEICEPARKFLKMKYKPEQQALYLYQQRLLLLRHASKCPIETEKCGVTPHCASTKKIWKHIPDCTDSTCSFPQCVGARSMLWHYFNCKDCNCQVCAPVREVVVQSHARAKALQQLQQEQSPDFSGGAVQRKPPSKRIPEQHRLALYQQQQRLLLFQHASSCSAETEECKVFSCCAKIKELWKHIADCTLQPCNVPPCASSRHVMNHYIRCKDYYCAVCVPVRDAIAKENISLTTNQIDAQWIEAATAAQKLDEPHGSSPEITPNDYFMSANHQLLVDQQEINKLDDQHSCKLVNNKEGKQKEISSVQQNTANRGVDEMGCIGRGCDPTNPQPKRLKIDWAENQIASLIQAGISNEISSSLTPHRPSTDFSNEYLVENPQMLQQLNLNLIKTAMRNEEIKSVAQNSETELVDAIIPQKSNSIQSQQFVSNWQSESDISHRKFIQNEIPKQRILVANPEGGTRKGPHVAKRPIDSLHHNVDSLAACSDLYTFHSCLQQPLEFKNTATKDKLKQEQIIIDGLSEIGFVTVMESCQVLERGKVLNSALIGLPSLSDEQLEALLPAQLNYLRFKSKVVHQAALRSIVQLKSEGLYLLPLNIANRQKWDAKNAAFQLDKYFGLVDEKDFF